MTSHSPSPADAEPMAVVQRAIDEHRHRPGALLPLLHGIQDVLGFVPAQGVPLIAAALNLSRAEVHGVITYYHHFRSHAVGQHVLQVCRAESCQARGGAALLEHARQALGCAEGEHHSADGQWSVEPVYCLGLCASSPAVQIDDRLHARMTVAKLDRLTSALTEVQA